MEDSGRPSGTQFLMLGIIGAYLGRRYDQSKGRPLFLIRGMVFGAAKGRPHPESKLVRRLRRRPSCPVRITADDRRRVSEGRGANPSAGGDDRCSRSAVPDHSGSACRFPHCRWDEHRNRSGVVRIVLMALAQGTFNYMGALVCAHVAAVLCAFVLYPAGSCSGLPAKCCAIWPASNWLTSITGPQFRHTAGPGGSVWLAGAAVPVRHRRRDRGLHLVCSPRISFRRSPAQLGPTEQQQA